ncbi:PAS domain-containing hybrid sensor histidine kinase/response regulator [Aquabacterium sp. J223]|uniref:PAS domain-containing hybrid sensor histidine kinase/response regulator n=1 Tax=Aquabacterium sp. J223 TaxID=2898431 RepID=UPI0021AD82B8|nr:PAS domain-containing hybrid sensor histidine kinase/response regulator [Aquabacterium sp. J223]UUX96003.1 PAS domain S-box protein [Aquabacterium sp. J223]
MSAARKADIEETASPFDDDDPPPVPWPPDVNPNPSAPVAALPSDSLFMRREPVVRDPRLRITRYFFATAAGIAAAVAVLFALVPQPMALGLRAGLVGGSLLLLLTCLAAMRVSEARLPQAIAAVVAVVIALITLPALGLHWGLHTAALGFLALTTCMVLAVGYHRLGLAVAVLSLAVMLLLAGSEQVTPAVPQGLTVRFVLQALTLGCGVFAGLYLSSVTRHHMDDSHRREQRFQSLLWIASDAYWELDAQYRVVSVWRSGNAEGEDGRFEPVPGVPRVAPWDLTPLHGDEERLDELRAELEGRRPFRDLRLRWQDPRGERHLLVSGEPRFDARGVFCGFWGVVRDNTPHVHAQQALAATETRYQELFNRIPTALVLQRGGRVITGNAAAAVLFGHAGLSVMGGQELLQACDNPQERERARRRFEELEALPVGAALAIGELRLVSPRGRRLVVRASGVRVQADGGPATLTIYLDDTDRKTAEDAVRRSEALLSHVVATSPDAISLAELDSGRYAMVNDRFLQLYGLRLEEVLGRTAAELGLQSAGQEPQAMLQRLRDEGRVQNQPLEFVDREGRRVSLLLSAALFVMDGRSYVVQISRDISELERTRQEYAAILQNASVGIAFVRERRFVQANPQCERMLGWAPGTLVGQSSRVVWPSDEAFEQIGRDIGPVLAEGRGVDIERPLMRRDGRTFLCRIQASAVDPTRPGKNGTIWILDDVTERRQMDAALAKARDDAEAASRAKSAFLANTSHELRTPLNALVGLTRLVRQPDLEEPLRRQYIDQIADSAESLSAIISDILDLAKIEAGKLQVDTMAFDLHAMLATLQRGYTTLADARGLNFQLELGPEVPRVVMGDRNRVRQILNNYLSNALKFTTRGAISLRVHGPTQGLVRFEVRDTGPGMDAATQSRLFRPFTQADQSTTRRYGGTGLGLSICHELAALMGGSVGVHSQPGTGSSFWAELPLDEATDEAVASSGFGTLDGDDDALAGARVLMVEDNPVNMMIAVALLQQWGARVVEAHDGREAVAAVERAEAAGDPFDAVLMDVQMPEMGGHEATSLLRRRYDAQRLPIVALTAAALVSEREQALAVGMNAFLTKPIDAQRLREVLGDVLTRRRKST